MKLHHNGEFIYLLVDKRKKMLQKVTFRWCAESLDENLSLSHNKLTKEKGIVMISRLQEDFHEIKI